MKPTITKAEKVQAQKDFDLIQQAAHRLNKLGMPLDDIDNILYATRCMNRHLVIESATSINELPPVQEFQPVRAI